MKRTLCALAAGLLCAGPAAAQTVPSAAPLVPGGPAQPMLRTGTAVQLQLEELLTTKGKKLRVGQHFRLSVREPVTVDAHVVIPVGAPATGEIIAVRNKGMWGKSGHLTASLLHVSVQDRQIRLTGTFDDKGVTGTGGVVAAVALLPVAGFFTTGTSAKIEQGARIDGFIGEDVPLVFAEAVVPRPISVPVARPSDPLPADSGAAPGSTTPAPRDPSFK
ncbi:hypothetical protein PIB19_00930 [Sphingomonas sp. 7/4-4]|uniref:hypothetical protein n=1 Tax=Sphingomonas sp. 7/4-4 TaxID=3018446 RepID=UPI0022F3C5BD|nr:hypothetical protein [Sphingomonas sp. 7/4-4]WBY08152.1 hypothetical protein PIB19_00930 [Sphingomonas sp. 7/4-4]